MPFQWISDNVTEVAITGMWSNGRPIVNVLHVKRDEDNPAESARDVLNNWQDHMMGDFPDNYVLQGARYTDHNELEGSTGFVIPDPAKRVEGDNDTSSPSPNTCVLVHKSIDGHTGVRSGRMYLPPPVESQVDENGYLTPTIIAAWVTNLGLFFDGLSGPQETSLVVVHKTPATAGQSDASLVTGLRVDPLVATMRRRIRR